MTDHVFPDDNASVVNGNRGDDHVSLLTAMTEHRVS